MKSILIAFALVLSASAFAHEDTTTTASTTTPKAFNTMKALAGTWQGTADMHGKTENVTVTYTVTSAERQSKKS